MRIVSLCLALLASPVAAHEFWIEPLEWQVTTDEMVFAKLLTGTQFKGTETAYLPKHFDRFEIYTDGSPMPVEGHLDDRPAMQVEALPEGLAVAAYVSSEFALLYPSTEVFHEFAAEHDLTAVASRHEERGLPDANFIEIFTRHSKALIGVGNASGSDLRVGHATELVALDNPYADDLGGLVRVQLFDGETVQTDAQVELYARAPDGTVELTRHRTDTEGIVALPVRAGHDYLANAVLLREASIEETGGADWETLWASLTFAVPE